MRNQGAGVFNMTEREEDIVIIVGERFERRLTEETGKLRVEMAQGFGALRAEMIDRNGKLLQWLLLFGVTQTAALATVVALAR